MDLHAQVADLRSKVADLEAKLAFLYRHLSVAYAPSADLQNEPVLALLRANKLLEAVRCYTDIHQTGLAESKAAVETLKARHNL